MQNFVLPSLYPSSIQHGCYMMIYIWFCLTQLFFFCELTQLYPVKLINKVMLGVGVWAQGLICCNLTALKRALMAGPTVVAGMGQ